MFSESKRADAFPGGTVFAIFSTACARFLFWDSHRLRFGLRLPRRRKLAQPSVLKTFVEQCLSTHNFNFETGILERLPR
jgi:hypothetical protein